ncbi:Zinc finger, CCHC-type [Sergentomyia squamirostris]
MILSPRMQRWQVTMSIFDCELKYRPGKDQGNCDGLSRLPIDSPEPWLDEEINLKSLHSTDGPINYEIVRAATRSDRELMKLKELICDGWPENPQNLPDNMKEYWKFRSSLSVDDDCIYYGFRIVIPPPENPHDRSHQDESHRQCPMCAIRSQSGIEANENITPPERIVSKHRSLVTNSKPNLNLNKSPAAHHSFPRRLP